MYNVFIDGKAGTTGLRIYDRLAQDSEIKLMTLRDDERKDAAKRKAMLNDCDIAFLCLPDEAAKEAVSFIENDHVKIIDTSTAHRTNPDWAYGLPELSVQHFAHVQNGTRVCVPGCHASGFIALVYPLVAQGFIAKDMALSCFSLTGYSGGGNQMIGQYEAEDRDCSLASPRLYATAQNHKHVPEMTLHTGLNKPPVFQPIVADYFNGMIVNVPLHRSQLKSNATVQTIQQAYAEHYRGGVIRVLPYTGTDHIFAANAARDYDDMILSVEGNDDRMHLVARFDNLGKGASGAAIQCMNIMLGRDETKGLVLAGGEMFS